MTIFRISHPAIRMGVSLAAALCLNAQEPAAPAAAPAKTAVLQAQGVPPRISPAEYLAQTKAGAVTIAAEFKGHSVPAGMNTYSSEDFVVVEVGLYGAPEARLQISLEDFSLRINGKKPPQRTQPAGMVVGSLKDPEWVPPEPPSKSKTGLNSGGEQGDSGPPPVPKMPFELVRAMSQNTLKASLPLGDRALPLAGLLFFQYRGKEKGITSLELIYTGPAGSATLKLPH